MSTPHCSYLDIYISQKIRLCVVDLEGKFQTIHLQAKLHIFLVWKFRSVILNFLIFLQDLSNSSAYCNLSLSKELKYLNWDLKQKCDSHVLTILKWQQQCAKSTGFDTFCKK